MDNFKRADVAEVSLHYKKGRDSEPVKIRESRTAYSVMKLFWDSNRIGLLEEFKIIMLDRANGVLGISHISTGGVDTCVVDPKIVFATALKANACQIILAHNHPSGNLRPSNSDIALTERMVSGGKLLGIEVLDHLVLSADDYYSFGDNGLMPMPTNRP